MTISVQSAAIQLTRNIWSWLRQVSGDAAYENYLRARSRAGSKRLSARAVQRAAASDPAALAGDEPLSPAEFYLDALRRRYSTVSRCC